MYAQTNKTRSLRSYAWSILVAFLIVGWVYPPVGIAALVCMLAPVIVAAASGKRKWCGLFCPRGLFSDVILSKISRHKKAPAILTSTYFKIAFLVFLMTNLVVGIIYAAGDIAAIGLVFVRLVSLTTAMAIVLGYVYSQRTWCGFCPMGFLATLFIKVRRRLKARTQEPDLQGVPQRGVVLFTGNQCPACDTLKSELQKFRVSFKEINIDQTKNAPNYMVARYGTSSIPVLVLNGKRLENTSPEKLAELDLAACSTELKAG